VVVVTPILVVEHPQVHHLTLVVELQADMLTDMLVMLDLKVELGAQVVMDN
jgi:hypothetical protein